MSEIIDNANPLYDQSKAAKKLGISYATLTYALARDKISPIQRKPVLLFQESELIRYAEENQILLKEE
jgi:hypothetical protein